MKIFDIWALVVLLALQLSCRTSYAENLELFVSTQGEEGNPGTIEDPFPTIAEALRKVAAISREQDKAITINVRGGSYYLKTPLVIDRSVWKSSKNKLTIKGYRNEKAKLLGGKVVRGWEKYKDNIFRVKLGSPIEVNQVFEKGRRGIKARYPNDKYLIVDEQTKVEEKKPFINKVKFYFKKEDLPKWDSVKGAQVFIWTGFDWFASVLPIESIDYERRFLSLSKRGKFPIVIKPERRFYVMNILEELDRPGEFYFNKESRELYYWPYDEKNLLNNVRVPTLEYLIRIKGESKNELVENVIINNLELSTTSFRTYFDGSYGTHGKGDRNEPVNKFAAVYLSDVSRCEISGCEISNVGYSGITITDSATEIAVRNNYIHHCGFHGVLISGYHAGYGPDMDVNHHNVVEDNYMHHCGELTGHGGGVFVWASGHNKIQYNTIHNMSRYGIGIKGQHLLNDRWQEDRVGAKVKNVNKECAVEQWQATTDNFDSLNHSGHNLIAYNDLLMTNEDSEDSGAITLNGTGLGNEICNNVIRHHRRELAGIGIGIYLDDLVMQTQVRNNLIYDFELGKNINAALFIKGGDNVLENNILYLTNSVGWNPAIWFHAFGGQYIRGMTIKRNIIYGKGNIAPIEFSVSGADRKTIGFDFSWIKEMDYNNVFQERKGPLVKVVDEKGVKAYSLERWRGRFPDKVSENTITSDPLFVDAENWNFQLKPESPALKLGFKQIDVSKVGIRSGFPEKFKSFLHLPIPNRAVQKE